jgi:hypothetical protein
LDPEITWPISPPIPDTDCIFESAALFFGINCLLYYEILPFVDESVYKLFEFWSYVNALIGAGLERNY